MLYSHKKGEEIVTPSVLVSADYCKSFYCTCLTELSHYNIQYNGLQQWYDLVFIKGIFTFQLFTTTQIFSFCMFFTLSIKNCMPIFQLEYKEAKNLKECLNDVVLYEGVIAAGALFMSISAIVNINRINKMQ